MPINIAQFFFVSASWLLAAAPSYAFNPAPDCELLIMTSQTSSLVDEMRPLTAKTLSDADQKRIKFSVGEQILSGIFQKNVMDMTPSEFQRVRDRVHVCAKDWKTPLPGHVSREAYLQVFDGQLSEISSILDTLKKNQLDLKAEASARIAQQDAEQDEIKADQDGRAQQEQAQIDELKKKIADAQQARQVADNLKEERQKLERRLTDAQRPADESAAITPVTPSQPSTPGQPAQQSQTAAAPTEESKLQVLQAYFLQLSIAQLCADADAGFSPEDIDTLKAGIKTLVDQSGVDNGKIGEIWDTTSILVNANRSKLTQNDCSQATDWFRYSLPSAKLGKATANPFN
ncbi:hypothetical protein [Rhizobium leguminosarum]|uniref:hypothetical protein n=1 Tax=Rhizobium leguminosarum TaxID=384 RepID=UPI00102FFD8F|nr:hypothetical protein [Rhizobium leguminosarum]TBF89125.1 hypothetical protein ELG82_36900 [Rhizobium leguminosarum]